MAVDIQSEQKSHRGLIVGELLLAVLLLAVAVSSLAALMYSVSHRTEARQESRQSTTTACAVNGVSAAGNCAPRVTSGGGAKLLRSPCVNRDGIPTRGCNDAVAKSDSSEETILRTRTDSVSLSLVAKRPKATERAARPERGFIR